MFRRILTRWFVDKEGVFGKAPSATIAATAFANSYLQATLNSQAYQKISKKPKGVGD